MTTAHKLVLPLNLETSFVTMENPSLKGAEKKIAQLNLLLEPVVFWKQTRINTVTENSIILTDDAPEIYSRYITNALRDSLEVTVFAATIGNKLPAHSSKCYKAGLLWESTITDIFGSFAVEHLTEKLKQHLRQVFLPRGLYPSLPFSPGYGDWSISSQKSILKYLQTTPEIEVTADHYLVPVKSITAVIGWLPRPAVKIYPAASTDFTAANCGFHKECSTCPHKTCPKYPPK